MKFPHDIEVVPIPKVIPNERPMLLKLTEKSRKIIQQKGGRANELLLMFSENEIETLKKILKE